MHVVDIQDDLGELFLASIGDQEPPDFLKTAEWREPYDLLDRDFALILIDDQGHELRKYASFDAGNTSMSVFYLLNSPHLLTPAAVKVAAANLIDSARAQGFTELPEEIFELAELGIGDWGRRVLDERRVQFLEKDAGIMMALGKAVEHGAQAAKRVGGAMRAIPGAVGSAASRATSSVARGAGTAVGATQQAAQATGQALSAAKSTASGAGSRALETLKAAPGNTVRRVQAAKANLVADFEAGRQAIRSPVHGPAPAPGFQPRPEIGALPAPPAAAPVAGAPAPPTFPVTVTPATARVPGAVAAPPSGGARVAVPNEPNPTLVAERSAPMAHASDTMSMATLSGPVTRPLPTAVSTSPPPGAAASTPTGGAAGEMTPAQRLLERVRAATQGGPNGVRTGPAPAAPTSASVPMVAGPPTATMPRPAPAPAGPPVVPAAQTAPMVRPTAPAPAGANTPGAPAQALPATAAPAGGAPATGNAPAVRQGGKGPKEKAKASTKEKANTEAPADGSSGKILPFAVGGGALAAAGAAGGYAAGQQKAASTFDLLKVAELRWHDLDPYDRHETAVHLCKLAETTGIEVPPHIFQYGGETLNPSFSALMAHRQQYVRDPALAEDYDRLGKMAGVMPHKDVVEALSILDDCAGLRPRYGDRLPDPLLCVFGQEKQAGWAWSSGGDYVNEDQLINFATSLVGGEKLEDLFSDALAVKFKKNPRSTFEGLPQEQKRIVARMAFQHTSERL